MAKTASDLSRRVVMKELMPISFREFLNIRKDYEIPILSFETIIKDKFSLTKKYLFTYEFFEEYLEYGGVLYPEGGFAEALENSLKKVILQDLSVLRAINMKYETDVYKLLYFIARSSPFETNYSSIARHLEISKTMAVRLVSDLEGAGIIIKVLPCQKKGIDIKKEPKIYLAIPFRKLFSKQGFEINKGSIREEFFVNHVKNICYLKGERGEKMPDFRVGDKIIEVGGTSKTNYQKADYILADGLSTDGNKIPLFLIGFIY